MSDPEHLAFGRDVPGGSAPRRVEEMCERIETGITASRAWAEDARHRAATLESAIVERAFRTWIGDDHAGADDRMP